MNRISPLSPKLTLAMVAAAALLGACGRQDDDRTAGQKVDAAIAQTEQKAQELKADAKDVGQDLSKTADSVANKSRDVAITAELKAELARDERLRATDINVDTVGGQVILRGFAPDTASRERAAQLAKAVQGVVGVDNQLSVQPRP